MRKRICLLGLLLIAGLTGCGSSGVEMEEFEKLESESEKDVSSGHAEFSDIGENGIPKHVSSVLNGEGKVKMVLDADVESKGYDEAKIYTMKPIVMTEERMVSLAESLFDGGKYTSQLPYKYWEKADLEEEKKRFDEMEDSEEAESKGYIMDMMLRFNLMAALQQKEPQKMPSLVEGATMFYEGDPALTNVFGKYVKEQFCNLRGTINGKEYLLCYKEIVGGELNDLYTIQLKPLFPIGTIEAMFNTEKYMSPSEPASIEGMENPCDMKALQNEAEALLKKLGCEDFAFVSSRQNEIYNPNTETSNLNGYQLTYVRDFDEMSRDITMSNYALVRYDEDKATGTPLESVKLQMTQEGLESFEMVVHYDLGEPLAEDVNLLSFDQINQAVEEMMKSVNPQSQNEKLYQTVLFGDETEIPIIRLTYMPAEYEGQCVYMPMWCYYLDITDPWNGSGESKLPVFAVSAVDGKIYNYALFHSMDQETGDATVMEE